jgi:hypothetical protein
MADERTYGFNRDDADALIQSIGSGEDWFPEVRSRGGGGRRSAVIGSALSAPSSSLVAATSCTIYFLELQSDGTQELNPTAGTVYNDDPEVTAEVGTYCRVETLNGRLMIYYLGCNIQDDLVTAIGAL